jgi:hypothetical protein
VVDVRRRCERHTDLRAALEIHALGMPCQKHMLRTPATEKMREKPRKYHFFPNQSIFVVRNSSTFAFLDQQLLAVSS